MADMFLDGNEIITKAIAEFYRNSSGEKLNSVFEAVRTRMHEDGHFIFPILKDKDNSGSFSFRTIKTEDGKFWQAAFTSQEEMDRGAPSEAMSFFIDKSMEFCLQSGMEGILINPWGQSFKLTKDAMKAIIEADGGVEYSVPDDPITAELLEDGSYLKRAVEICNRNRTQLNLLKLLIILRDSYVWVPCNAIMSDADYEAVERQVMTAKEAGELDSIVGQTFVTNDCVRLVPDILQNGDNYFFPVFTAAEEMGEYGEHFSKVEKHFLETIVLAENNEKNVAGIVINAFTEPFVINKEVFSIVEGMKSGLTDEDEETV